MATTAKRRRPEDSSGSGSFVEMRYTSAFESQSQRLRVDGECFWKDGRDGRWMACQAQPLHCYQSVVVLVLVPVGASQLRNTAARNSAAGVRHGTSVSGQVPGTPCWTRVPSSSLWQSNQVTHEPLPSASPCRPGPAGPCWTLLGRKAQMQASAERLHALVSRRKSRKTASQGGKLTKVEVGLVYCSLSRLPLFSPRCLLVGGW
ncbi:hypothetical protein V8C42DRAFT_69801 [Trichoderma barbatum]